LLSDQAGGGVFYGCCCSAKYELRAKPEAAMLRVTTRSTLPVFAESHGFYPWMNAKRVSAEAAYFAYGYEG